MKRFTIGHNKYLWLVSTLFLARITFRVVGEEGWILEAALLASLTLMLALLALDQFLKMVTVDSRKVVIHSLLRIRELKLQDVSEIRLLDERAGLSSGIVLVGTARQTLVIDPVFKDYFALAQVLINMSITSSLVLPKITSRLLSEANLSESYRKQADLFARRTFAFGLRVAGKNYATQPAT